MKKKRAPTDATLRNVRAANKKLAILTVEVTRLTKALSDVDRRVQQLERKRVR